MLGMSSSYPHLSLHVAGQWLSAASGGERAVVNPADESVLATLPLVYEPGTVWSPSFACITCRQTTTRNMKWEYRTVMFEASR